MIIQTWTGLHGDENDTNGTLIAGSPMGLNWWWGALSLPTIGSQPAVDLPRDEGQIKFDNQGRPEGIHLAPNGKVDQIEVLEFYLNKYYDAGFRRFIFRLPGGAAFGQDFTVNQWQLMPAWKQNFFNGIDPLPDPDPTTSFWTRWRLDHPGCVFEVYVGAAVPMGLCSPCYNSNTVAGQLFEAKAAQVTLPGGLSERRWVVACPNVPQADDYNPRDQRHVNAMVQAIQPWINAGFSGFWFDASSSNGLVGQVDPKVYGRRWAQLELSFQPYFRNQVYHPEFPVSYVRFGGENIPTNAGDVVDDCSVAFTAWYGDSTQATLWQIPNGSTTPVRTFKPAQDGWFFDRTRSEVLFAIIPARSIPRPAPLPPFEEPSFTSAELGEARRRGYVLAAYNLDNFRDAEYIKRWYSMGPILVADFNADGVVNIEDQINFNAALDASLAQQLAGGNPLKVFARGEVNQDGAITEADRTYWQSVYNHCLANPGSCALVNYGGADDK